MKILILCCLLFSASAVFGQASSPNEEVRKGFNEVNDWVLKAAELVPADKYSYKPVDTVRSFGQLVAHITDSYNFFCARGAGNKVEWADPVEKGNTDKDTVLPKLKEAIGRCNATYGAANAQFGPLMGNVGHTSLHYGNMVTYIRMMGLKPPSS
ncbi:MAG TPA: DinB family protein [Pyrinomonadaceae bacterium]|nr:DinB family protein [Pyrinomonadaceae bacterium]